MRKHLEQMTVKEVDFLKRKVVERLEQREIHTSSHFLQRLEEKKISIDSFVNIANGFEVIEFEKTENSVNKVVIRTEHCKVNDLVVVILLGRKNTIKTAWLNRKDDLHETLNLSNYTDIDVLATFNSLDVVIN